MISSRIAEVAVRERTTTTADGVDVVRVAGLVRELLTALGEDPDRDGLRQTPQRVAETWVDLVAGLGRDAAAPLASVIPVGRGVEGGVTSGAVLVRGIRFRSVCEHHLLPFAGWAHIAYLPNEKVVGLGALPKVVDILASRLQLQERLGEQIADAIATALDARGVLVVLEAVHHCVTMRARTQPDVSTITIASRGLLADPAARSEVVMLIGASARR